MRGFALYALSCLVIIALMSAVAWLVTKADVRSVVMVSAMLAMAVQVTAFAIARLLQPQRLMLGWGLGSLLRLAVLVLYALVMARLWRASLTPALLSFVAFLFVTTVVEPVFLRR